MTIDLETSDGRALSVNAWNWGTLHHIVACADVFETELWEPMRFNCGGTLQPAQVAALADFLAQRILPRLADGERVLVDGTITAVPDDGTFYREAAEQWRNYSLHRDVLVDIIEFLRSAPGPVSVL